MPYLPEAHSDAETASWMETTVLALHDVAVAEVDGQVVGFAAVEGDLLAHSTSLPPSSRRFYQERGCRLVELTDGAENEEREPDALYEWVPPSPR